MSFWNDSRADETRRRWLDGQSAQKIADAFGNVVCANDASGKAAGPETAAEPALISLLERFYQQLSQGEEPLRLTPLELETLAPLLGSLPLELEQAADGTPRLWSRRSWQRQQRLIAALVERLSQHGGLLVTGGAGFLGSHLVDLLLLLDLCLPHH